MMFHHSMGRNQRAKGFKAKNILHVPVLLAVVVWLLYQTKHSYDRKNEYAETDYNKLRKGDTDINFGRKINPGSENRISIDPRGKNSDETAEMGKSGEGQDVFYQNNEEKAEELKIGSEESREDITNSGKEETQQEPKGNVDDNDDSRSVDEVNTEGAHESIRLPSQMDGDNFDQNEGGNADGNSVEENGLPKDGATSADDTNSSDGETRTSDEASSSTSQIKTGENAGQGSETNETSGEHSDTALPATEELSSSSASDDQSNKNISDDNDAGKGETVESQEGTGSDIETANNNTVEEVTTNPRSDAEIVTENSNFPNSTVENNVVSVNDEAPKREGESHLVEIAGNSSLEAATSGASSDGENTHIPKSVEENDVVMPDSNGAPAREEGESQVDTVSEDQVTGNSSIEAVAADTSSEGGNANLPNSEEKGEVMSDVNGVPKWEEVQSQTDHVSEGEKADNNSSEKANSNRRSASEASEKEADVSQGANASEAKVTTNNTVEQENDLKSNDEDASNSSLANENEHVELPANGEEAVVEEVQSQGNSTSDAENPDKNSLGEDKSGKSDDLVANSGQNNEQSNSELPISETNGEVASHEDSALKGESTSENSENVKDAMADPQSKDAPNTDSGLSDDRTAEAQEDSTGSGSYNSGSQEDIKKLAEL